MLLLSSMAKKHRLLPITSSSMVLPLILLLFTRSYVQAQPLSNNTNSSSADQKSYFSSANFSTITVVVIVVIIGALFFICVLAYLQRCGEDATEFVTATAAAIIGSLSRRQRGIQTPILQTFPTLVYSDVKENKIGKGAVECAVCLNEFEDDDTISLLPKCEHVFHQQCIEAWLATRVTCPACRVDYSTVDPPTGTDGASTVAAASVEAAVAPDQNTPPTDHVAISVLNEDERNDEMKELARIASTVRGNGSGRPRRLRRSHSMEYSMMRGQGEGFYRLPENVAKEIIASGIAVAGGDEGSSRKVGRLFGEGSSSRGRIMRLGRSDRWPSFSVRSSSFRVPVWGSSCRRSWEGPLKEDLLARPPPVRSTTYISP